MIDRNHVRARSIRKEIEHRLQLHDYTLSKLSELSHINNGHLSGFLNGNPGRTLTVAQLDSIANVFDEPPGWLYDLYIDECFPKGRVSRRRVCPYLIRCAELGRHDCIQPVVSALLEQRKNIEILFYVAEQLFQHGRQEESIYFYQLVIDNEKDSYSDRFIMSHYRLFRSLQETDMEENWKAVIRFEAYRKRLSERHQLDALLQLANVCFTLHKWKEVEKYGDELRKLAALVYQKELSKLKNNRYYQPLKTERHLVVYYGQGYLLKAVSLEKQGHYEQAKEYVSGYADLSWFELLDDSGQEEVEKFNLWATANMYTLDMLMGNTSVLADYIAFLEDHPTEILSGIVTIMKSANQHGFLIDHLLEKFSAEIRTFEHSHDSICVDRHLRFRYDLAIYHFQNERFESGIIDTLRCLDLSIVMNNQKKFIQCVTLFEAYRYHATEQQKREYKKLLEEVRKDEGIFAIASNGFWNV
ncbi:DNA-binding protein [Brevibacillus laterosporus]|uniref:DNA-binding protein n=1 Tax=Brevibacillus laterosporus TaxID=1465 RepID=UPI000BD702B7|nr:DNA-binding protein [Brevibacillus laterosporus]PCN43611.1 DNA-binding protein [Brevibacillus laterosporus]